MKTLLAFLAFSALSFAQPPTRFLQGTAAAASSDCDAATELGGVHIQTGNPASVATRVSVCVQTGASTYAWNPVGHKVATTAPATCVTGELFFDSDASAGSNWYGCTSANTWTALGGGGGSGDIEGVTAGNGISGGGTSGTVTVTNAAPLYGCTDTGGDDAYVCAPTGFPVAYATGQTLLITFTTANTGAATIDAGPGAKAIKLPGGSSDPATGDIVALKPMLVRYDETANGAAGGWILAGTACGTGLICTGGTPAVDPTQVGFLGTANTWSATQTFVAPALGTPASGVATNLTGLPTAGLVDNAVTSAKLAVVNTRHVCDIGIGDTSGSALTNAQLGPQKRGCFIPAAATVVEVDVAADAGTPNVIVGRNVAGTQANILSAALATAASGGIACSKTSAVTGIDGATTCSATLQNTALAAGSYLELVSGTAGGTAKWMTVHVIYTID